MKIILFCFFAIPFTCCNSKREVIRANDAYCLKTSTEAIELVTKKWLEIYGDHIYDKQPFTAELQNDTIWVVQGTLPKGKDGGVPHAEINAKNCEFIKIIHTK